MSSPCAWSSVRSLHLDPPFLLLALPSAPFPLPQLPEVCGKPAQLLQREYGTPLTSSPSPQVMSPRPTTSTRPQSSATCSSWTRRRSSPTKSLLRTPTTMTLHSRICSTRHTEYRAYHSLREDLSVSLSSSSMSDRTGRPVGDRPGRLGEHRSSEAQIGDSARQAKRANSCRMPSKN